MARVDAVLPAHFAVCGPEQLSVDLILGALSVHSHTKENNGKAALQNRKESHK